VKNATFPICIVGEQERRRQKREVKVGVKEGTGRSMGTHNLSSQPIPPAKTFLENKIENLKDFFQDLEHVSPRYK
jgi:hypothetical protein